MPAATKLGNLVPLTDFAARFHLPYSTANAMAKEGRLPGLLRFGTRYYVPLSVVEAIESGDMADLVAAGVVAPYAPKGA